jgi:hypothetical protein
MTHGQLQRHAAPHAVPDDERALDAEALREAGDLVGELGNGVRRGHVALPVAGQIGRDDAMLASQVR